MITENRTPAPIIAGKWLALGLSPIPIPTASKAATVAWGTLSVTKETIAVHFKSNDNVAVKLGGASNGIVDIDLDSNEAVMLSQYLFDDAPWTFGRGQNGDKQTRHIMIQCPHVKPFKVKWPRSLKTHADKAFILELLGEGQYVIGPGSIHEGTGQLIQWHKNPDKPPLTLSPDELTRRINRLAGAAILVRSWSDFEGSRHFVVRDLAGACHHAGWTEFEIHQHIGAILHCVDDPEIRDRKKAVDDTLTKAATGEAITGFASLADYLSPDVAEALKTLWGLSTDVMDTLTIGGTPLTAAQTVTHPTVTIWPELLPFDESFQAVEHVYPMDSLGPVMTAAVRDVISVQQVPAALAAQSVLIAASSVAHGLFNVLLDGRTIPLSLWMILVGQAGERKTSADTLVNRLITQRMAEAKLAYRIDLAAWKTAKKESPDDAGPKPRSPDWLISRGTTEGILNSLAHNWPAASFSTADAGSWFGGYSMREGRDMSTASVLSDLWSGQWHNSVKASDDEAVTLFDRRLALSLMLQPNIAAELFSNSLLHGQGFLSRCLPAFPASKIGTREYNHVEHIPGLNNFNTALDRLLTSGIKIEPVSGAITFQDITLTAEARELWISIYNHIETNMAAGGTYEDIKEVANKMPEQVLRLAGVRAAIEGKAFINVDDMMGAKVLIKYYLSVWLSLSGKLNRFIPEVAEPAKLLSWMQLRRSKTNNTFFLLSDMCRSGPRLIRGKPDLGRKLLEELINRGYVRMSGSMYELRPTEAV